jgi:hypothetical protein
MPVTPLDEYPLQQLETTFDHVEDSDRRWFERYWLCVHAPDGTVALSAGVGVYPNANLMDGFAAAVAGGRQATVRAARTLGPDRLDTRVGPLRAEVLRGLSTLRVSCGTAELAFELELATIAPPLDLTRLPFLRLANGALHQHASLFVQAGRARGRLHIGGRDHSVDGWPFTRTNAWGIRSHAGGLDAVEPGWTPSAPFLSAVAGERWLCLVEDGSWQVDDDAIRVRVDGETLELTPLATIGLSRGWSGHADFFDGLYAGDAAYEGLTEIDVGDAPTAGSLTGRDDHIVRIAGADGLETVGVLELGKRS